MAGFRTDFFYPFEPLSKTLFAERSIFLCTRNRLPLVEQPPGICVLSRFLRGLNFFFGSVDQSDYLGKELGNYFAPAWFVRSGRGLVLPGQKLNDQIPSDIQPFIKNCPNRHLALFNRRQRLRKPR